MYWDNSRSFAIEEVTFVTEKKITDKAKIYNWVIIFFNETFNYDDGEELLGIAGNAERLCRIVKQYKESKRVSFFQNFLLNRWKYDMSHRNWYFIVRWFMLWVPVPEAVLCVVGVFWNSLFAEQSNVVLYFISRNS